MAKRCIYPPMPLKAVKPSKGTLEVPVTNYRKAAFSWLSKLSRMSQKCRTTGDFWL